MYVLGHCSVLLTWMKLIFFSKIRDIEESNGKLWTTRSLSLFDSDDNVMIIRILDSNQKISDHVTDSLKSLFQLLQKKKIKKKLSYGETLTGKKYIQKSEKKMKERNSDFSGEKPNT